MVFTAVLAAIAVIAAMVTVPWGKAQAEESAPTDFVPNVDLGSEHDKGGLGVSMDWGNLVWAGKPATDAENGNASRQGSPQNDAGWGLCIDPGMNTPMNNKYRYERSMATKLEINDPYRDAAISLASKLERAYKNGDTEFERDN